MMRGFTLWFTGLPCSGKTTLATLVKQGLRLSGHTAEHLDEDVFRKELCKDLTFSKENQITSVERATYVALLLSQNGLATLVSCVSPYRQMRAHARKRIEHFIEVYVRCPLEICEARDVKGMYKLARMGNAGVSDPYEAPVDPEIVVDTDTMDIQACCEKILSYLESKNLILPRNPFPESKVLTKAYQFASLHHWGQKRKGGGAPYLTHPVAVALMLHQAGYGEDVVAAGLLHDVLEDSGCDLEEMECAVGKSITRLVVEVTESSKKEPWNNRKRNYLLCLKSASPEALAVACADKIHNIRSLMQGFASGGDNFLSLFSGKFNEKVKNYNEIYEIIRTAAPACRLLPDYAKCLEDLDGVAQSAANSNDPAYKRSIR